MTAVPAAQTVRAVQQIKQAFRGSGSGKQGEKRSSALSSGKGGVGKSLVTSMLAVSMNRKGHHTAILDADITGPSIPMAFGVAERETGCDSGWTSDDSGKILRGRGDHVCQSAS